MNRIFLAALLALTGCASAERIFVGEELVPYAQASAACDAYGASLVTLEDASPQDIFDAWLASPVDADGVWIGETLVGVTGALYGYAMIRGGGLVPVATNDTTHLGLPVCVTPE
jgi:hypothetical protein